LTNSTDTKPDTRPDLKASATLPSVEPEATPAPETETLLESLASICSVFVLGLFAMTFVFQNYEIPSGSMEKTLLIGDHVVVDRATFAPPTAWAPFDHHRDIRRGDVIVFYKPNPESPDLILVKRAIGLPGDRIHLRNGIVFLNGVAQNEPQTSQPNDSDPYQPFRDDFPSVLPDTSYGATATWSVEAPSHIQGDDLVVPPGKVFAMGDNRLSSLDGRYWGFVPRENILGRPLFVYWSFETPADQIDKTALSDHIAFIVHIATHIFTETRWSRTLHIIR
jgi:signal peptidase I